ncbi:hypothetical protein KCP73_12565 [Salmonella enterica subsp. enterica]|nr:hypothetical protein KCP73_12565 [Salmonella enterica subsp. enterica]
MRLIPPTPHSDRENAMKNGLVTRLVGVFWRSLAALTVAEYWGYRHYWRP